MKTIEEAAKEYANSLSSNEVFNVQHAKDFKAGAEFIQRWIPVEEELPICDRDLILFKIKVSNPVIVKYNNGQYEIAIFNGAGWYNTKEQWIFKPTYWRPIEVK